MAESILVVEDELSLRETLVYNLKKQGYAVEAVGDGRAAIEAARRMNPDLIVLDIMLPELDGFEVCKILRDEMTVPILMLTARDEEIDRVAGLEFGADDYLTKPFSMRELMARVNLSWGRIEKTIELLSLESPAPIAKQGSKWQLTAAKLSEAFWQRAERLTTFTSCPYCSLYTGFASDAGESRMGSGGESSFTTTAHEPLLAS
jgi:DNA-binding response OmpR family regulator